MTRFLCVLAVMLAALSARADEGVEAAISGQIAALRAGDFVTAFEFASPNIRQIFRTPENFEDMVRQGYAVMLNPVDMQFMTARQEGEALWQRVLYRDLHGEVQVFDYQMVQAPEGWRINAVVRVKMPAPSA